MSSSIIPKIALAIIATAVALIFCAFVSNFANTANAQTRFVPDGNKTQSFTSDAFYVDDETGCHYILVLNGVGGVAVIPRMKKSGVQYCE